MSEALVPAPTAGRVATERHGSSARMQAMRTVVGVDTAKRVFQLHWVDPATGEMVDLRLSRAQFLEHFANRRACVVGIEACSDSPRWARRLGELGHEDPAA